MKALILNSGVGSRMKNLATCKCLVELTEGVTIFDAQIASLQRCGINDFIITTGPHANELEAIARKEHSNANFTFINNPLYNQTNYIYSINLAEDFISNSDILLLHGDLVFEQNVLQDIIASDKSVMVTDSTKPLPEKDFKAIVKNEKIIKVSVDTFEMEGGKCYYAQPLYKLAKNDWNLWLDEIKNFCKNGETGVYAENAFNAISQQMNITPLDIKGRMCFEVDNLEDLAYAQAAYEKMPDRLQDVYTGYNSTNHINNIIKEAKKPFVVCGSLKEEAKKLFGANAICFSDYTPNPDVKEVAAGAEKFKNENCDFIISIGGGSAIDTAKGIKKDMPTIKHLTIPTTAGTGSESTQFSVLYENGEKLSIDQPNLMPEYVILEPKYLNSLLEYHKKSALLDALCQAIESLWAVNSTPQSKTYALSAMQLIYANAEDYINGNKSSALRIFHAANLAGKAISISKTTAAHAMSYKLSTLFGLAHGHAVALCLVPVWGHLIDINTLLDCLTQKDYDDFIDLFRILNIECDCIGKIHEQAEFLASSVNTERLGNHPVRLSCSDLEKLYISLANPYRKRKHLMRML